MVKISENLRFGRVISAHGRRYRVEDASDLIDIDCVTKGRKQDVVVNDRVCYQFTSPRQGVITSVEPRTSLLYRSDAYHQKMLAANIDQVVVVVATWPPLYESLLSRILLAVEAAGVSALIILNKADLPETETAMPLMRYFESLGYKVLRFSTLEPVQPLADALSGQTNFLIGQSGVGKSTLLNRLLPTANTRTNEVSQTLRSGRHTTTHSTVYHIDSKTDLIDTPGLQEFGLAHVSQEDLINSFVEFRPFVGHCRFANCSHMTEPGCLIINALNNGNIRKERHALYIKLLIEPGSRVSSY